MSRLDELIDELAPSGVPFKKLGEVGELIRGTGLQKSDLIDAGAPAIHYGQIHTYYGTSTSATKSFTDPGLAAKLRRAKPGDLIIATTSEDDAAVAKATAWIGDGEVAVSGDAYIYRHTFDPRYAAYFFQSEQFQDQKAKHLTGTKVRRISGDALGMIRIPVPPRAVQAEIVKILDHFTTLETEVIAELEVRKQQRFDLARTLRGAPYGRSVDGEVVELVRLGEVATQHIEPLRVQTDVSYTNLGVKWYSEGAFARESKLGSAIKGTTLYKVKPNQFIYNRMFVTEGSFAVVAPELAAGVVSNEFPVYDLDSSRVLPEWLLLYFQDEYTLKRIAGEVTGTERGSTKSRRRWKEEQFEAFQIELPSVSAQLEFLRVVGTVAALESALSDELVARRQQYEHYRDKLLTFAEAVA